MRLLCRLVEKDGAFMFDEACLNTFIEIKKRLIAAPIKVASNWNIPFEIMCDAYESTIRAILGQTHEKIFWAIYYASRTLNEA